MSDAVSQILNVAVTLSTADRFVVIDSLVASMDPLDPSRDAAWTREAADRLAAYDAGLIEAIDAEDDLAEFDGP